MPNEFTDNVSPIIQAPEGTLRCSINDKFTYMKPVAFELLGTTYDVESHDWSDLLASLCKVLYEKDRDLFCSICEDPALLESKAQYFYKEAQYKIQRNRNCCQTTPIQGTGYHVRTSIDNDKKRTLIKKLLHAYNIGESGISFYLIPTERAHRNELNG